MGKHVDYRYFEFYPANERKEWAKRKFYVRVLFGEGKIETKGGGGGWESKKRPYLQPLTIWRGPEEPYQHKIPFMLDAYGSGDLTDVEQQKKEIESLAGVLEFSNPETHAIEEPPQLILSGNGTIPHDDFVDHGLHTWIICEPPEWGEWIRNRAGILLRQAGTLCFQRYEGDLGFARKNSANANGKHLLANGKQTFEEIAHHQLGHAEWGTKLAHLNHKQSARDVPRAGLIKGPSKAQENQWKHEGGRPRKIWKGW